MKIRYHLAALFSLISTFNVLAQNALPEAKLNSLFDKMIDGKSVTMGVISIKQGNQTWTRAAGKLKEDSPYFIASVTKLYTTAVILQLQSEGLLSLDNTIATHLPDWIINTRASHPNNTLATHQQWSQHPRQALFRG